MSGNALLSQEGSAARQGRARGGSDAILLRDLDFASIELPI